jgi:hypothetical protein
MDPDPDSKLAVPIESLDRRQNVERRGHRLTSIVVVGLGPTEAEQDPVSAVSLDIAAVTADHRDNLVLVGLDQLAVFFRISCRRELGRTNEVTEDHSDRAELGPESDTHRFGQSADTFLLGNTGSARRAESSAVGQHLRAGVAVSDHEIAPDECGRDGAVVQLKGGRR